MSQGVPTTAREAVMATDSPKLSPASGAGLFNVALGVVGERSESAKTYALPAFDAPVSSPGAPTATCKPVVATECPNRSNAAGVGLGIVRVGTVGD